MLNHHSTKIVPPCYLQFVEFLSEATEDNSGVRMLKHVFNHQGALTHDVAQAVGVNNVSEAARRGNEYLKHNGIYDSELFCLAPAGGKSSSHHWFVGEKVQ